MQVLNRFNIQNKCADCKKRGSSFFCNLSEEALKTFESLKLTNAYPKGSTLYMQGQRANGVYVLCHGRVKLSTCSKDGKVIILHIAEPGEVLGLSTTISNTVHLATAEVVEPCQVNFVKKEDFLTFIKQSPEACLSAVRQLGTNYQTAYFQICSLGLSNSVADRLASLFLAWCKEHSEGYNTVQLKMPYTHEEIAQMIGTSRETVTRLLKDFKERKLISLKGSNLVIHDKRMLEQAVWN
jgi:CRP/FNR family transcriptional regulator, cyclic AMP receptor protein